MMEKLSLKSKNCENELENNKEEASRGWTVHKKKTREIQIINRLKFYQ